MIEDYHVEDEGGHAPEEPIQRGDLILSEIEREIIKSRWQML